LLSFYEEHRWCGDLDSNVAQVAPGRWRVWIQCHGCGARIDRDACLPDAAIANRAIRVSMVAEPVSPSRACPPAHHLRTLSIASPARAPFRLVERLPRSILHGAPGHLVEGGALHDRVRDPGRVERRAPASREFLQLQVRALRPHSGHDRA